MGGAAPITVPFRGVNVDPDTGDALKELAAISGSIYVEPIPGYGSYRNNTASGGTDTGGGHCDLNLEGRTDAEARKLETLARSLGFVAYFRPRVSPYSGNSYGWQRHLHLIRRDCRDLSSKAKWQVGEYDAGRDGLAVPHKDTGSRAYVGMTWAKYKAAKAVRAAAASKPQPAPVLTPAGDDMPAPKDLWNWDGVPAPKANLAADPKNTHWTPSSYLYYTYASLADMRAQVADLTAQVKALTDALNNKS